MNDDWVNTLVRVKKHQLLMLQDRGYTFPPSEVAWFELSEAQMAQRLRQLGLEWPEAFEAVYTEPKTLWVSYVAGDTGMKLDAARDFLAAAEAHQRPLKRLMLIGAARPTRMAWDEFAGYNVDFWTLAQLAVNVTRHFLRQRHIALAPDEKRRFLTTSKIDPQCLPLMYASDPVARWYDFRVGQIIKIERTNLIDVASERSVFYRLVVPEPLTEHATRPVRGLP